MELTFLLGRHDPHEHTALFGELESVVEQVTCNYGLNEGYRDELAGGGLKIVGVDTNRDVRIVELPTHRFFVATLFLLQLSSSPGIPHPLIMAYMKAALAFRDLYDTEKL